MQKKHKWARRLRTQKKQASCLSDGCNTLEAKRIRRWVAAPVLMSASFKLACCCVVSNRMWASCSCVATFFCGAGSGRWREVCQTHTGPRDAHAPELMRKRKVAIQSCVDNLFFLHGLFGRLSRMSAGRRSNVFAPLQFQLSWLLLLLLSPRLSNTLAIGNNADETRHARRACCSGCLIFLHVACARTRVFRYDTWAKNPARPAIRVFSSSQLDVAKLAVCWDVYGLFPR